MAEEVPETSTVHTEIKNNFVKQIGLQLHRQQDKYTLTKPLSIYPTELVLRLHTERSFFLGKTKAHHVVKKFPTFHRT